MNQEFHLKGFNALLGMQVDKIENGVAELTVPIKPGLLNSAATVHGGALASMADCAAGAAAFSTVPIDQHCITTDLHMTYMKSVSEGVLRCVGNVIHQSRRKLAVEASIHQGEALIAKAQVSFMIVERRQPFNA